MTTDKELPVLNGMQKRQLSNLARTCVLYGQGMVITAVANRIQPLKRDRVKSKVNAYGQVVYKTARKILRPEYQPSYGEGGYRTLEDLDQKYWYFLADCRAAYRQSRASNELLHVGNMRYSHEEFEQLYKANRPHRRQWKNDYVFDLVKREVKKMGISDRQLKKEQKKLIERAFRTFSSSEILFIRRRARWRASVGANTEARALYFNEQVQRWKEYFRAKGLQYIGCPKLKPYKGVYNETYWYNFRDKYIPEEAFDFAYFPKPEMK